MHLTNGKLPRFNYFVLRMSGRRTYRTVETRANEHRLPLLYINFLIRTVIDNRNRIFSTISLFLNSFLVLQKGGYISNSRI